MVSMMDAAEVRRMIVEIKTEMRNAAGDELGSSRRRRRRSLLHATRPPPPAFAGVCGGGGGGLRAQLLSPSPAGVGS